MMKILSWHAIRLDDINRINTLKMMRINVAIQVMEIYIILTLNRVTGSVARWSRGMIHALGVRSRVKILDEPS